MAEPTGLPSTLRMSRPGALGRALFASKAMMERSARMVDWVEPKRPVLFDSESHFRPVCTLAVYAGSRIHANTERAVVSMLRASPPDRVILVAAPLTVPAA